jgi:hypothetical protein
MGWGVGSLVPRPLPLKNGREETLAKFFGYADIAFT